MSEVMEYNDLREMEEPIIVEFEDEDGNTIPCELVASFEYEGTTYVVAYDINDEEASYVLKVTHVEEGDMLESIDDEEEFNKLVEIVDKMDL